MALLTRFLEVANNELKQISSARNYFHYMGISVSEFFVIQARFADTDIQYATRCIIMNEWDQSEFIMCMETAQAA